MKAKPGALLHIAEAGGLEYGPFGLTKVGLVVQGKPSFDDWSRCGSLLQQVEGALQFWIGDWLNYGEKAYGDKYAEAINATQVNTWRQYAWVANAVTLSTRVDNLSWAHHREVAPLDRSAQRKLLDQAASEHWTVSQLKQAVRQHEHQRKIQADHDRQVASGSFAVVCADPPWDYNNSGFDQAAASQYPTLTTDAICDLPQTDPTFPQFADNAVLFLWVTSPMVPDGLRVLSTWGFTYRASIVWLKNRAPGLGWWVNTKHELLMIGDRGTLQESVLIGERGALHPLEKHDSVIMAPVNQHSRKPSALYEAVDRMYPGLRKIEIFARENRDGWTVWGNEV